LYLSENFSKRKSVFVGKFL